MFNIIKNGEYTLYEVINMAKMNFVLSLYSFIL